VITGTGIPMENLTPAFALDVPTAANPNTAAAKINFFIFTFRYPAFSALSFRRGHLIFIQCACISI
jgi:hypothetical protein